jgi:hypothetical protein
MDVRLKTERTRDWLERFCFSNPEETMPQQNQRSTESPASLVAIIVAARRAGDRELERDARQKLASRFGVKLNFAREPKGGER